MSIWFIFLYQPLVNLLLFLYQALGSNLGIAIIAVTVLIRLVLIPLTMPGMKSAQKMQELKPELDKLKEKHKDDKQALAKAQLELYQQHGINPMGSIVPMIIQFIVLIALLQAFNNVVKPNAGAEELNKVLYPFIQLPANAHLNTSFLYLDITKPDVFPLPQKINLGITSVDALPGLFLIAAAAVQFISSKMMMPTAKNKAAVASGKSNEASGGEDLAMAMQQQMMFITPLMTLLIGLRFPAGLVLYWLTFSFMMILQQLYTNRTKAAPEKAITK